MASRNHLWLLVSTRQQISKNKDNFHILLLVVPGLYIALGLPTVKYGSYPYFLIFVAVLKPTATGDSAMPSSS